MHTGDNPNSTKEKHIITRVVNCIVVRMSDSDLWIETNVFSNER